jgi:hypothetical protein
MGSNMQRQGVPLLLTDAPIVFDLTADALETGVLGGSVVADELIMGVTSVGLPGFVVEALVRPETDLEPDAAGECKSISAGAIFRAVPAVRGVVR